jgi:heme exporter protein C
LRSAASAELGLLFTILATITGTIFGRFTWGLQSGIWWNWDPRETAIFVLLLIYGAYFALRSAVADEERRASLSAVYSILAFVTVPFLIFVIPRVMFSLHPENALAGEGATAGILRNPRTMIIFLASLVSTTGIYVWAYRLRLRLGQLERRWP